MKNKNLKQYDVSMMFKSSLGYFLKNPERFELVQVVHSEEAITAAGSHIYFVFNDKATKQRIALFYPTKDNDIKDTFESDGDPKPFSVALRAYQTACVDSSENICDVLYMPIAYTRRGLFGKRAHWVMGACKTKEGSFVIRDPKRNLFYPVKYLLNTCQKMLGVHASIQHLGIQPIRNGVDCGPYSIEIMKALVEGKTDFKNEIKKIDEKRGQHTQDVKRAAVLLEKLNADKTMTAVDSVSPCIEIVDWTAKTQYGEFCEGVSIDRRVYDQVQSAAEIINHDFPSVTPVIKVLQAALKKELMKEFDVYGIWEKIWIRKINSGKVTEEFKMFNDLVAMETMKQSVSGRNSKEGENAEKILNQLMKKQEQRLNTLLLQQITRLAKPLVGSYESAMSDELSDKSISDLVFLINYYKVDLDDTSRAYCQIFQAMKMMDSMRMLYLVGVTTGSVSDCPNEKIINLVKDSENKNEFDDFSRLTSRKRKKLHAKLRKIHREMPKSFKVKSKKALREDEKIFMQQVNTVLQAANAYAEYLLHQVQAIAEPKKPSFFRHAWNIVSFKWLRKGVSKKKLYEEDFVEVVQGPTENALLHKALGGTKAVLDPVGKRDGKAPPKYDADDCLQPAKQAVIAMEAEEQQSGSRLYTAGC